MLSLETHNMYLELYAIFVNLLNLIRLLSYLMNIYMGIIIIITIYLSKTNILLPRNMCYLFEIQCFYYVECKVTPTPWGCVRVCVYGYLQFAFSK